MAITTTSTSLSLLFADLHEGVPGARNALITALQENLTRLTAAILRDFPIVERKRQVESLLQDLNGKLLGAIDDGVHPENVTEFIKFAAFRLRQMLRDEATKLRRRGEMAPLADANHSAIRGVAEPAAVEDSVSLLLQWEEFQSKVQSLSDEELVIFDFHFHMQLPQSEVAELLSLSPKAVSRAWLTAAKKLKGSIPTMDAPKRVLILSRNKAWESPEATKLFACWRAMQIRAIAIPEGELSVAAGLVDWADAVVVTKSGDLERIRRLPSLVGKGVCSLDLADEFNPADKVQVESLWEPLIKLFEKNRSEAFG